MTNRHLQANLPVSAFVAVSSDALDRVGRVVDTTHATMEELAIRTMKNGLVAPTGPAGLGDLSPRNDIPPLYIRLPSTISPDPSSQQAKPNVQVTFVPNERTVGGSLRTLNLFLLNQFHSKKYILN